MRKRNQAGAYQNDLFAGLLSDPKIQKLKNYPQHRTTNTYEHSKHVTETCLKWSHNRGMSIDEETLIRATMLHDYYLYHIEDKGLNAWQHGTRHAQIAVNNASSDFKLSEKEKEIMLSHMWPLNITKIPKSKEAWLICLADKICALEEEFFWQKKMKE